MEYSEKRPDLIVFVNGMPLIMFELKSPSREETDASDVRVSIGGKIRKGGLQRARHLGLTFRASYTPVPRPNTAVP